MKVNTNRVITTTSHAPVEPISEVMPDCAGVGASKD
jgi:hypothetical protein